MKSLLTALTLVIALLAVPAAQELTPDDLSLRSRITARYDVVPLSGGLGLRPKASNSDVRLIEISDAISINGVVVTGRELQDRVGSDADAILRLSYLSPATRSALFAPPPAPPAAPIAPEAPSQPSTPAPPEPPDRDRHESGGDRVRIFGDVHVREDESIRGQVVAVLGSVRIDGEVGDQVVAVLGSVELGEHAVVRGDVVSVGGHVIRAPGSEIRGAVTEVALADGPWQGRAGPWLGGIGALSLFGGFGAVPRLMGTVFRVVLMLLLVSLAMVIARPAVEGSAARVTDNPLKATVLGLAAEVLFIPLLVLTCIVLAITIVGIPLLVLMPFVVLLALLMALVGFAGVSLAVGQWARRRFTVGVMPGFGDLWIGLLIILLPLLVGRLLALGGFITGPFAFILIAAGIGMEFLAWSTGIGAILSNGLSRWRARRAYPMTTA